MDAHDRQAEPDSTRAFGPFTLDLQRAALTRDGRPVLLRPKTFGLLTYFADHPGRVLGKQELLAAVWPGVVVTDDSLSQCVRELRSALGDQAEGLIRTVPRRGYIFEPPAAAAMAKEATHRTPPIRRPIGWIGLGLAASLVVGGLAFVGSHDASKVRIDQAIKARRSIAVMPFLEHGPDPRGYFAESVTEDLITELSRLPDTLVIARASAAVVAARETDPRAIGRELGVRQVLFGNVRREGSAVQINARFVAAETGAVLWSDQFNYRDAAEWDWRRDIALRVARVLDVRLTAAARQPVRSGRQPDAIDAVVEGQHLIRHLRKREDVLRARALFEAAVTLEPDSASALTGLAHAHLSDVEFFRPPDTQAQLAVAEQAIARALAVDPDYAYAQCLVGHVLRARGDYEGALTVYERYLAAYPSEAWAHARIGEVKLLLGRPQEVAAHMDAALALSPLEHNLIAYAQFRAGAAEFHLGRDDSAYRRFREAAAALPDFPALRLPMAAIDALHGRQAQAAAHVAEVRRVRPDLTITAWLEESGPRRGTAGTERLAEGLRRAGLAQ